MTTRLLTSAALGTLLAACTPPPQAAGGDSAVSRDSTVRLGTTKLEAFSAKTGAVIVRGFTDMGGVSGEFGSGVSVQAREMTNAGDGSRAIGLAITVLGSSTMERSSTSYVDYDEIESLLQGIDYIGRIDRKSTHLRDVQADYRTRGDLAVSTYSASSGRMEASMVSGEIGAARAFFRLSQLPEIRRLIGRSKALLDSINALTPATSGRDSVARP